MTTFTNTNKNSVVSTANTSKNSTSFLNILKHEEQTLETLANFTFESVVFADGTLLKNITFDQLVGTVWSNLNKS
jgi:hypothetical protein